MEGEDLAMRVIDRSGARLRRHQEEEVARALFLALYLAPENKASVCYQRARASFEDVFSQEEGRLGEGVSELVISGNSSLRKV